MTVCLAVTFLALPLSAGRGWAQETPTPNPTPTHHVGVNPIKDPWPALKPEELQAVQDLIDKGMKQEALDKLVEILKRYCCNFETMKGGKPVFDPDLKYAGETQRAKGGSVRIGKAFGRGAGRLYSVLKHEMVHSQQWQDLNAKDTKEQNRQRECDAYQREIDNADNTNISEGYRNELPGLRDKYCKD